VSFVGLFTFKIKEEKMSRVLVYLISIAAGALFGDVFIHLIPEISETSGFTINVSLSFLVGVLIFFILEKVIHSQHYHGHDHGHENKKNKMKKKEIQPFAYMSLIVSSLHNFLDGLIITAAYIVSIPAGIGTTFAVLLHEVPHELGSFSILVHGGFSRKKALLINFISGLFGFLGVLVALILANQIDKIQTILIPVAAGGLLYIAGSDLIPELHKESSNTKSSFLQILMLVLGMAIMLLLLVVG
jgi:zinc and cadmium transporter